MNIRSLALAVLIITLFAGCTSTPTRDVFFSLPSKLQNPYWQTVSLNITSSDIHWARDVSQRISSDSYLRIGMNVSGTPKSHGVVVQSVVSNAPAGIAGLVAGDIITKINGIQIRGELDFREIISQNTAPFNLIVKRPNGIDSFTIKSDSATIGSASHMAPVWQIGSNAPCTLSQGSHALLLRSAHENITATAIATVKTIMGHEMVAIHEITPSLIRRAATGETFILSNDSLSGNSSASIVIGGRYAPEHITLTPPNIAIRLLLPDGFTVLSTRKGLVTNGIFTIGAWDRSVTFSIIRPDGHKYAAIFKIGEIQFPDAVTQYDLAIDKKDIRQMETGARLHWDIIGSNGNKIVTLSMERS